MKEESIYLATNIVRLNSYKEKEVCGLTKPVHEKKKETIYIATIILRLNNYTEKN